MKVAFCLMSERVYEFNPIQREDSRCSFRSTEELCCFLQSASLDKCKLLHYSNKPTRSQFNRTITPSSKLAPELQGPFHQQNPNISTLTIEVGQYPNRCSRRSQKNPLCKWYFDGLSAKCRKPSHPLFTGAIKYFIFS